jgi:hypothetical protein
VTVVFSLARVGSFSQFSVAGDSGAVRRQSGSFGNFVALAFTAVPFDSTRVGSFLQFSIGAKSGSFGNFGQPANRVRLVIFLSTSAWRPSRLPLRILPRSKPPSLRLARRSRGMDSFPDSANVNPRWPGAAGW